MILPFFLKSKNNHWQENWVEIHRTDDNWKVELIKTLLSRNEIVCRPDHGSQIKIYVEPNDEELAREIISQVDVAFAEHNLLEKSTPFQERSDSVLENFSVDIGYVNLAENHEIGRIVQYSDQKIELQVGPEPHHVFSEKEWEEFTDFSAQRQEFLILLRHEYPDLLKWLKSQKLLVQFIRLVQSSYQNS